MSTWRVIITASEGPTGIAPVCKEMGHGHFVDGVTLANWVFDCCPQPRIETWGETAAAGLALLLTSLDAESCS